MKMEEVGWSRRAENYGVSTVAVHGPGVLSPSLYNDRCQLSLPTLEVPQIQFLAGVCGHSCLASETGTHSANCAVAVRGAAFYGGVYG